MQHIFNDTDVEVIINKLKDDSFNATTPMFPNCKGCGETTEEALEKLSKSISRFIQKTTKDYLSQRFTSSSYSNVVTRVNDKNNNMQHRVYHQEDKKKFKQKNIYLESLQEILDEVSDTTKIQARDKSPFDLFVDKTKGSDSPPILGISLCLN
ncbi:hypothetical protein OAJ27_00720 [bacterium]|nr:hypothetical protein [bacterium]